MKVLHLTGGGDIGGAKTHVLSLVKDLGKQIDVKMISFRHGPFAEDAKSLGIDVLVTSKWNIVKEIRTVLRIIREEKFEIIHSHGAKANLIAIVARLMTKLPTITTVHSDYKLDYMHSFIKKCTFGFINSIALRFFDYYICVSKSLRKTLITRNFSASNIFTLPNGIDFENDLGVLSKPLFADKYGLKFDDEDLVVGILARLTAVKGLNIFLQSASLIIKENPKVKFLIGGDGEDRKALERLSLSLGISDHVFFLGHVLESYEFMNFIDINVLSSLSEGFPYSILEGARLKKATISSDVGGISDLIDSGDNGYLFNSGDYKKLAEHILELAKNQQKRMEMGEKVFEKSKQLFSMDNMCNSQLAIYSRILSKKADTYAYDVMISGYYGFRNSGDDAILMAIIDNLRIQKEDIRVLVLSKKPKETRRDYVVDSVNRLNIIKIMGAMKKTKLFINGGGNLMQDDTSTRSLLYYLTTIWLAKKMHLKVMVYANGIGPINKNFNRRLTQSVLNTIDIITLREELSILELERLHITGPKIIVTADPALTVEAVKGSKIDEIFKDEGIDAEGPFVGFSARICENNMKYDESKIAAIADYMIETYGITPVFIPMQPIDLSIIESIVSKMKGRGFVIRKKYDVSITIGIISRMDMLIGMRLHSLIYAASLGIPVIGLVYDPKVEAFLQYFHQTSAGHVNQLRMETLQPIVDNVWIKRLEIKTELKKVTLLLKEKAFENSKIAIELLEGK